MHCPFNTSVVGFVTADSVRDFFSYIGHACPGNKRTVKMHILEMHISEWMSAGFGLMGEQGTEAIHATSINCTGHMAVW